MTIREAVAPAEVELLINGPGRHCVPLNVYCTILFSCRRQLGTPDESQVDRNTFFPILPSVLERFPRQRTNGQRQGTSLLREMLSPTRTGKIGSQRSDSKVGLQFCPRLCERCSSPTGILEFGKPLLLYQ